MFLCTRGKCSLWIICLCDYIFMNLELPGFYKSLKTFFLSSVNIYTSERDRFPFMESCYVWHFSSLFSNLLNYFLLSFFESKRKLLLICFPLTSVKYTVLDAWILLSTLVFGPIYSWFYYFAGTKVLLKLLRTDSLLLKCFMYAQNVFYRHSLIYLF